MVWLRFMKRLRMIQKVTALITRYGAAGGELLVFRHPRAGVQLPAGTVEIGETVEQALRREVEEEAGLTEVTLHQYLGFQSLTLPEEQRMVLQPAKLLDAAAFDASSLAFALNRGTTVRVLGEQAEGGSRFVQVCYEEYDLNFTPPALRLSVSGWLRSSVLTRQVERHFFHLMPSTPTPETWSTETDTHVFQLYWVALAPRPQLVFSQQAWLDDHYEQLFRAYARLE